jgi:signal transduction histidine kinase
MLTKEKKIVWMILVCIVLMCAFLWSIRTKADCVMINSEDGIWDLQEADFTESIYGLSGNVEYVSGALLMPEEFDEQADIRLGWPQLDGEYATSRLKIYVPEGTVVAFMGYSANFASKIFINGNWLEDVGVVGENGGSAKAGQKLLFFTVTAEEGTIEIVQQASNFTHKDPESHLTWYLGSYHNLEQSFKSTVSVDAIILGVYLILFIASLVLFLIMRAYRAGLYLAILSLVWAVRTGVTNAKVLLELLPWLSWTAALRLEYIAIPAALILLVLTLNEIFPGIIAKSVRLFSYSIALGFVFIFIFMDTVMMSHLIMYCELIAAAVAVYILIRLLFKLRRPNTEQLIIIIGIVIILISLLLDTGYYHIPLIRNFLGGPTMETTLVIFTLFQFATVFFGVMRQMVQAREVEAKLAAENVMLTQINQMKNELLANVSHELKTPLAVVSVYAQLMMKKLKRGASYEEVDADLEMITSESARMAQMVAELIGLARIKSEEDIVYTKLDYAEVVRHTAKLYKTMIERQANELHLSIEDDGVFVKGSLDMLIRVLLNLLANANENTEDGQIVVVVFKRDKNVITEVTDTGKGMALELIERVFERYETRRKDGTGLGLSISREIILSHKGWIVIESTLGKGTTVRFSLPEYKGDEENGGANENIAGRG